MNLQHLDPGTLAANDKNPRSTLGDLDELTESIRTQGVLQPLLVTETTTDGQPEYRIIAGHRRAAAAIAAGLDTVPTIVVPASEYDAAGSIEAALAENLHRRDLTTSDQIHAVQQLIDLGVDADAIAKNTGLTKKRTKQLAAVAVAPDHVHEVVTRAEPTLDEAVALAEYSDYPQILADLEARAGGPSFAYGVETAATSKTRIDLVRARVAALTADGTHAVNKIEDGDAVRDWKVARGYDLGLDPDEHADCPHRVIVVGAYYGANPDLLETEYCTQPTTHPEYVELQQRRTARVNDNHAPDHEETPEEAKERRAREQAVKEVRRLREETWKSRLDAAAQHRLTWLTEWAKPKRPALPDDIEYRIAHWLTTGGEGIETYELTRFVNSADPDTDEENAEVQPDELHNAWPHGTPDSDWHRTTSLAYTTFALLIGLDLEFRSNWHERNTRLALDILTALGYTPTPLEQAFLDGQLHQYNPAADEIQPTDHVAQEA